MADLTSDPLWPTHLPTSDIIRCSLTYLPTQKSDVIYECSPSGPHNRAKPIMKLHWSIWAFMISIVWGFLNQIGAQISENICQNIRRNSNEFKLSSTQLMFASKNVLKFLYLCFTEYVDIFFSKMWWNFKKVHECFLSTVNYLLTVRVPISKNEDRIGAVAIVVATNCYLSFDPAADDQVTMENSPLIWFQK